MDGGWTDFLRNKAFFAKDGGLRSQAYRNELCYCACCPHEWLDYVLVYPGPQAQYLQPTSMTLTAYPLKKLASTAPISVPLLDDAAMDDLSDHYPVLAEMTFDFPAAPPAYTILGACAPAPDSPARGMVVADAAGCERKPPTALSCSIYGASARAGCNLNDSCLFTSDVQGAASGAADAFQCAAGFSHKTQLHC